MPAFVPLSVYLTFMEDKVTTEQFFLVLLLFPPVSTIPPILHLHLHLHVVLVRKTNGRSPGTFKKSNSLSEIWGALDMKTFYFHSSGRNWLQSKTKDSIF